VVGKILYLRQTYHFGPRRIADYLKRFHDVSLAMSSVHRILRRHGMHRLPANLKHRPHGVRWKRHEKPQPGHRLQLDVKFLERIPGTQKRLYQFTAIDDCTRLRVLKVYDACNQPTAIQFIDEVVRRRPFRVHVIQTDNGPEFCSRALLTWAYNRGVALRLIEPGKPNQNAYIELFNGRFRDECLDEHWFTSLAHAQVVIETWRREYNEERPKKSLGGNFACAMANHLDPRKALSARDFAPYGHRRRVMISSNIRRSDSGRD
jgi:transposase InsO family protein